MTGLLVVISMRLISSWVPFYPTLHVYARLPVRPTPRQVVYVEPVRSAVRESGPERSLESHKFVQRSDGSWDIERIVKKPYVDPLSQRNVVDIPVRSVFGRHNNPGSRHRYSDLVPLPSSPVVTRKTAPRKRTRKKHVSNKMPSNAQVMGCAYEPGCGWGSDVKKVSGSVDWGVKTPLCLF